MTHKKNTPEKDNSKKMTDAEEVARELGKAKSIDDFYGKEGIFARLFSETIEQMLEAELTEELGYEPYKAKGRNSGNNASIYTMFLTLPICVSSQVTEVTCSRRIYITPIISKQK